MKKQNVSNVSPTIFLIRSNLTRYQVNFKNIYGYNLTLLIDRCKKVGLIYNWVCKSYQIHEVNIKNLLKQLDEIKSLKINGINMDFNLVNLPNNQLKMILSVKSNYSYLQNTYQKKQKSKRLILLDRLGFERFKFISNLYQCHKKGLIKPKRRSVLLICFEIQQILWQQNVFKGTQFKLTKIGTEQIKCKSFSKQSMHLKISNNEQQFKQKEIEFQIFFLNYQILYFLKQSFPSLKIFFSTFNSILIDDSEVLVQSDISISLNNQYSEVIKLLLQNHSIKNQLIFIYTQLPEIKNLIPVLIILQPKSYGGLKFCQLNDKFIKSKLNLQENKLLTQAQLFLKRRYKNQNKTLREIMFLLKQTVFVNQTKENKHIRYAPTSNQIQISLKNQGIQKFRVMDKKYKKYNQKVNLKQIIQRIHENAQNPKFQIVSQYSQHIMKKQSNNYLIEARQLILHQKIQSLRNYIIYYNSLHLRIAIIIQDQHLYKLIKNLLNDTQINFIQYTIKGLKQQQIGSVSFSRKQEGFKQFNNNLQIKVCLINRNTILKQHQQALKLTQKNKNFTQLNINIMNYEPYNQLFEQQLLIPKITGAHIIIQVDAFWFPINQLKEKIIHQIFNYQFQFYLPKSQRQKQQTKSQIQQKYQVEWIKSKPKKVYFICKNSYEKILIQKFKIKQEQIINYLIKQKQGYKIYPHRDTSIKGIENHIIFTQSENYKNCQSIDYLDIDEQYDKIQSVLRNSKIQNKDKVFLPKYTETKSFKQIIQQKEAQLIKNVPGTSQLKLEQNFEALQSNKQILVKIESNQNYNTNQMYHQSQKKILQRKQNQIELIQSQFKLLAKRQNLQPEFNSTESEEKSQQQEICSSNIKQEQMLIEKNKSFSQSKESEATLEESKSLQNFQFAQKKKSQITQTLKCITKSNIEEIFKSLIKNQQQNLDLVQNQQELLTESQQSQQSDNYVKQHQYFQNKNLQFFAKQPIFDAYISQIQQQLETINQNIKTHSQTLQNNLLNDSAIQIVQSQNQKIHFKTKKYKTNHLKKRKKYQIKSNQRISTNIIIDDQIEDLDLIESKNLKPRQIYQKAVSKSKRLWEKKVKKNREKIICKQKSLSVDLVRNKSIFLNQDCKKKLLQKLRKINQQLEQKNVYK